jgi:hypothetical protein
MVKPTQRTRTISTKLSDEEYARVSAAAGNDSVSEWVRDTVLEALDGGTKAAAPVAAPTSAPIAAKDVEALMAELLAFRSLMLTLLFRVANGGQITEAELRKLIERADQDKRKKAIERLSG